ncbi:MAG: hypothetical protein ACLQSR_03320 [Limisphaerales bacterium]
MENKNISEELPAVGEHVLVQCRGYRCLACRTENGTWRAVYSNQELKDVIAILPSGQELEY